MSWLWALSADYDGSWSQRYIGASNNRGVLFGAPYMRDPQFGVHYGQELST